MAPVIILVLLGVFALFIFFYKKPKKSTVFSENYRSLLTTHVAFYTRLNSGGRKRFEEKITDFLSYVRIEGVNTEIDDLDKVLVAASAVIPAFYFDTWKYYNVNNVLLYPGTFNRDEYQAEGYEKNTLGMVGNGPMQHVMILSKPALHAGFDNRGKNNTGIHEFVHLLDKEDGAVDGLPEALLTRKQNAAWLQLVSSNMDDIIKGESDLNSYGASNRAEFLSVAAEYFFNDPDSFKEHHGDLYEMMAKMFQVPA